MINKRFCRIAGGAISAVATISALSTPASAASCDGIAFASRAQLGDEPLLLNGLGIRKATMLGIYVYVAGLYLPEPEDDAQTVLDRNPTWQVVLEFVRDVGKEEIREAWHEALERNGVDLSAFASVIQELDRLIEDVHEGDRLTLTHVSGAGLRLGFEGREHIIPGDEFARAVLTIWLGPQPPNKALKEGLLGGPCP